VDAKLPPRHPAEREPPETIRTFPSSEQPLTSAVTLRQEQEHVLDDSASGLRIDTGTQAVVARIECMAVIHEPRSPLVASVAYLPERKYGVIRLVRWREADCPAGCFRHPVHRPGRSCFACSLSYMLDILQSLDYLDRHYSFNYGWQLASLRDAEGRSA